MFIHAALVLTLISLVSSNDLELGPKDGGGRKILDELRKASPLLWRRENAVYVRTTDDELIHRIVVSDLRDNKDGIARVVEGGVGENEVLIELSSPGVLKGYEFHVEVYSTPNPNPKPRDNTAAVKDVTNQTPDNSRIIGARQKRSWFAASDEDYGSDSGSEESTENAKDEKVKPLEKKPTDEDKPKTPQTSSTEKPLIPQEPALTNPRQIIDSLPPVSPNAEGSTAVPSTEQPQGLPESQNPAVTSPQPLPEGSQGPDVSSPQPLPVAADSSLPAVPPTDVNPTTLTADATPSVDPANLNATVASPPTPAQ